MEILCDTVQIEATEIKEALKGISVKMSFQWEKTWAKFY